MLDARPRHWTPARAAKGVGGPPKWFEAQSASPKDTLNLDEDAVRTWCACWHLVWRGEKTSPLVLQGWDYARTSPPSVTSPALLVDGLGVSTKVFSAETISKSPKLKSLTQGSGSYNQPSVSTSGTKLDEAQKDEEWWYLLSWEVAQSGDPITRSRLPSYVSYRPVRIAMPWLHSDIASSVSYSYFSPLCSGLKIFIVQ